MERANAVIVSTLTKFALNNAKEWDKLLPKAILSINISKQKTTGYSPFYLMHGYHPRIPPNEIHIGTLIEDSDRCHQLDLLTEARKLALERIENIHLYNKKKYDLRRLEHNFQEGSYVVYEWYKPTDTKLTPRFKGPFKILKKIGSVCYEIQDMNKPSVKKIVHTQFLKPLVTPHNLDLISDISADDDNHYTNDDHPMDVHPRDDSHENATPDSSSDEYHSSEELQPERHNHPQNDDTTKDDHSSDISSTRPFVTSRGRYTKLPQKY